MGLTLLGAASLVLGVRIIAEVATTSAREHPLWAGIGAGLIGLSYGIAMGWLR